MKRAETGAGQKPQPSKTEDWGTRHLKIIQCPGHPSSIQLEASSQVRVARKSPTLEHHEGAAPKVQIRSKAGAPGRKIKIVSKGGPPAIIF
jgi:hypothetical protein